MIAAGPQPWYKYRVPIFLIQAVAFDVMSFDIRDESYAAVALRQSVKMRLDVSPREVRRARMHNIHLLVDWAKGVNGHVKIGGH